MTDEQKPNHAFARSLSNAGLGKRPTCSGKYIFKPFWNGVEQPEKRVFVRIKKVVVSDDGEKRNELVFRYAGYDILVCATNPERWMPNVQIEGQPASGLSRSNAGLGGNDAKKGQQ